MSVQALKSIAASIRKIAADPDERGAIDTDALLTEVRRIEAQAEWVEIELADRKEVEGVGG